MAAVAGFPQIVTPAKAGVHFSDGTMFHMHFLASQPHGTLSC
jgi:hypothetical protein